MLNLLVVTPTKISNCMLDKHTMEVVTESVHSIRHVGLHEAYFSIEPDLGPAFTAWVLDQGWTVEEAEWNHPESLYVGAKRAERPLTVFSVKF